MKKKKLLVMLLVFAMVFTVALSGCGGGDTDEPDEAEDPAPSDEGEDTEEPEEADNDGMADEQILKTNWESEPPSLDPQISQDATSSRILIDTLEGIIRMDEDGVPEEGSGMAESWEFSEDDTVITFHLRDANWSDGVPVTANDFVFSWLRALDPETASNYAFMGYDIKNGQAYNTGEIEDPNEVGIKAIDDKTLEVTLERPAPTFISKLQHSTFLPVREDKVEEWGTKYASEVEYLLSNGPFKVVEWEHESELVLEKNENYWNADSVKLERVEGVMVNESNTMINLYETGELDWTAVPSQYLEEYADEVSTSPEASTFYYTYNTENEFFSNKKIRKAFSMAMDRTQIQETRTQGIVPPAWGFVPPGMPGLEGETFRESNGELLTDIGNGATVEEVQALFEEGLEEIGKTAEDMNGIKFLTFDSDSSLQIAQIWQQFWRDNLGVEVEIEQATFKIKIDRENKGDFAFSYSGWIGDYNDPMTFMDMWITGGSQNTALWSNEEYDELIKKAQTTSGDERMQAMLDAEKILMDELPIAPTDNSVAILLQQDYVKDVIRLPLQVTDGLAKAYIAEH